MKKLTWLVALLITLALVVTGCPGGGDPNDNNDVDIITKIDLTDVFSATETTQDKAIVTVSGSTVTFAYNNNAEIWGELVTPEDARWDASAYSGIKFEYKTPANITVFAQDTDSIFIFGFNDSDGWGAVPLADNWTEITLPFSILIRQDWFGTEGHTFDNSAIIKFAFQIGSDAASGDKIEIRNFSAIGVGKEPPPPPPSVADSPITVSFKNTAKNAKVKGSQFVTVSEQTITATWNPNDEDGAFRVKVELDEGVDISSGYNTFKMTWNAGESVYGGSFNISLYFSGNRMLTKDWASTGEVSFDFNDDNPSWASGWGDAAVGTITGFEIYSANDLGSTITITSISLE